VCAAIVKEMMYFMEPKIREATLKEPKVYVLLSVFTDKCSNSKNNTANPASPILMELGQIGFARSLEVASKRCLPSGNFFFDLK
jgi:hypothetical protein